MLAVYKWKEGSCIKLNPQVAGEVCDALDKQGRLTAAELVDVSRDEAAPLHNAFEWRDEVAAEKYRKVQAGHIIRSITVELRGSSEPVRAFFPVVVKGEGRRFANTEVILRDANSREQLLARALRELESFKRKYKVLAELADVFAAIDAAVDGDAPCTS